MPRIQTNPTQLARACAAIGLPDAASVAERLTQHIEAERLARRVEHLKRAAGEAAPARLGRPGWHPRVRPIKEELRQHLRDVQRARETFGMRFGPYLAAFKAGTPADMPALRVFDLYCERLQHLHESLTERLEAGGFFDARSLRKTAADLDLFVANERAEGRPAGALHWSQWEKPAVVRNIRRMFAELYAAYARDSGRELKRRIIPYFNSTAHARLHASWRQALEHTFGWDAAAAQPAQPGPALANPVRRVDVVLSLLEAPPPELQLSEEGRAALDSYFAFTGGKPFIRACEEVAEAAAYSGAHPSTDTDPMTGHMTYAPWRHAGFPDDLLLRLHTMAADVRLAEIDAEALATVEALVRVVDVDDEVQRRGLAAEQANEGR